MTFACARGAALAAFLCAGGALAAAGLQNPAAPAQPPQQPQPRPPVFRADARLVRVDAYPARDGRIIQGLTAADFEVLEDGKPQVIDNIEFIDSTSGVIAETARRDPNSQRDGFNLASDPRYRVFVLYLDSLHVSTAGSHGLRRPLVDMLNRVLGKHDLFGVLTPNQEPFRDLMLGQQTLSIDEQLAKYWTWGRAGTGDVSDEELMLLACFPRNIAAPLANRRRLDKVISDLEETVTILGGLREERKNLLLFTTGWVLPGRDDALAAGLSQGPPRVGVTDAGKPTLGSTRGGTADPRWCRDELNRLQGIDFQQRHRDLIARAREQNVTFYPVNPMGLEAGTSIGENRAIAYRTDRLQELAEGTDGVPIVSTNDLRAGLQRVIDDLAAHYLLSYYSTNTKWDGRVRRIEVRLKPAGTRVRARREYRAPTEEEMTLLRNPPAPPVPATPAGVDLALATLKRLRPSATINSYGRAVGRDLAVVGEIAAAHIEAGRWKGGGEMRIVVTSPSGEVAGTTTARFAPGTRAAMATVRVTAPGPWDAVVSVRADGEAPEEDRFTIAAPQEQLLGEPLVFRAAPAATAPLHPVAGFQFRRTERVVVEWPLSKPGAQLQGRILGRDGKALALPVTVTERTSGALQVAAAGLTLAPLTAGDYVIEVTAIAGRQTETRHVALRVNR